jgi:hypothetical protein
METLVRHFRDLTRAAFARHGFAYGELLAQWPEVVGRELAQFCEPERLRWPRGQQDATRKLGGVLTIRAIPGRALDVEYDAPRIIERINGFYGYAAVSDIKVTQSPFHRPTAQHRDGAQGYDVRSGQARDLESALSRLGAAVKAQRDASSVGADANRQE